MLAFLHDWGSCKLLRYSLGTHSLRRRAREGHGAVCFYFNWSHITKFFVSSCTNIFQSPPFLLVSLFFWYHVLASFNLASPLISIYNLLFGVKKKKLNHLLHKHSGNEWWCMRFNTWALWFLLFSQGFIFVCFFSSKELEGLFCLPPFTVCINFLWWSPVITE